MGKNANVSIGKLVIFISMLLVAAIAAGVLMQTSQSLTQDSAISGERTRREISTHVVPISLTGSGNDDGNLTTLEFRVKSAPGSGRITLDQSLLRVVAGSSVATLAYRGEGSVCERSNSNGYNTFSTQEFGRVSVHEADKWTDGGWTIITYSGNPTNLHLDLDDDGVNDSVMTCYSGPGGDNCPDQYLDTYLQFNLSSAGYVYVPFRNSNGSISNLLDLDGFNISHENISSYGYISGYRPRGSAAGRLSEAMDPCTFEVHKNPLKLEEDLDDDSSDDYLVLNKTHVLIRLSNTSNISIALNEALTGGNTLDVDTTITDGSTDFGDLSIQGVTTGAHQIDESVAFQIVPENSGQGYYCAEYDHRSTDWIDGILQEGDIVKLCFEPSEEFSEDMAGTVTFIPTKGSETKVDFTISNVINTGNYELYP